MLVYITNRKINNFQTATPTQLTDIGRDLKDEAETIKLGLYKDNAVQFYGDSDAGSLFDSLPSDAYTRPWVILLHGFHQDVGETIQKAHMLNQHHGVNVILFSWPSRPTEISEILSGDYKEALIDFAKSALMGSRKLNITSAVLGEIKKIVDDYKDNYKPARSNARKSTQDFYQALEFVKEHLVDNGRVSKLSLIVHSMGNYLFRHTLHDMNRLPIEFYNIVLHQADIKASNHASWIPKLFGYARNRVYITINVLDTVLAGSYILHSIDLESNRERLGQSSTIKPGGSHQGYIQDYVRYLDFTDGKYIENKHEIFTGGPNDIDPVIASLLRRVFRSEQDGLPETKNTYNDSGFAYMPTRPSIYKPRYIMEDEELWDDSPDYDGTIESLSAFKDPFKPERPYDPDLDDD